MSVMDMNSRMAMAEKLSVQQLQQAIQSGSIPAYIGIPLIEQKTKERAQMAAAQGGQQKPPSVAASILQQAEQQEQQEQQGISQLPSNLPMMEEGEDGYAGGGIVAFANGDIVEEANDALGRGDLEQINPMLARTNVPSGSRFLADAARLRDDPAYRAFAEQGGIEGDTRYSTFIELGNASTSASGPEYEPAPAPRQSRIPKLGGMAQNFARSATEDRSDYNTPEGREVAAQTIADREALLTGARTIGAGAKDVGRLGIETLGTGADYTSRFLNAVGINAPRVPAEYTLNRGSRPAFSNLSAELSSQVPEIEEPGGVGAPNVPSVAPANIDSQYIAQDMQEGRRGIAATPGARTVPPGTPGAPRPASRTAPTGSTPPARGALPATLDAAERSDSPAANKAVSMLDKYVAQLEKGGNDIDRDKKEALYMALIQGGLGMMGGTSPNAFANIAAGLLPATQAYQQAISGIKKGERERLEKLISTGLKKEEFLLKAEEIGVKRDTARMVYDAAMARTGAMGGSSAGADKQARLFAFNAGRDLNRVIADAAKLKNSEEYKEATRILNMPYDPKKPNPAIKQMRERAQSVVNSINQEATGRIEDARSAVEFYRSEAGMPPLTQSSPAGGGNIPKGVPQGSKQVGTSGGKPVYESPDGKRYIVE